MIHVLYHANCDDGFGAAWCAWGGGGHKNAAGFRSAAIKSVMA